MSPNTYLSKTSRPNFCCRTKINLMSHFRKISQGKTQIYAALCKLLPHQPEQIFHHRLKVFTTLHFLLSVKFPVGPKKVISFSQLLYKHSTENTRLEKKFAASWTMIWVSIFPKESRKRNGLYKKTKKLRCIPCIPY